MEIRKYAAFDVIGNSCDPKSKCSSKDEPIIKCYCCVSMGCVFMGCVSMSIIYVAIKLMHILVCFMIKTYVRLLFPMD
jgi:hypothetical protein